MRFTADEMAVLPSQSRFRDVKPGSGPEGRIVAEIKALRRGHRWRDWVYEMGSGAPWMYLARKHKMPIRDLKALWRRYKEQTNA